MTQVSDRLRGFLTQTYPSLGRVSGPGGGHSAVITLLTRYPSPARLHTAGADHVRALLKKSVPPMAERLTEEVFAALGSRP